MITHDKIFDTVIRSVTFSILYVLLIALIVGVLNIFVSLGLIIFEVLEGNFIHIDFIDVVVSVLTVFVLIDLFKTFVDYREHERIRLTYITDATILLVMREIASEVYAHKVEYEFVLSLSALLLALGVIRVIAAKYSPLED
ncbi:phosphate-starvation-inducible PsiE family protein [Methanococcoides orientis]|uniref:phosphate-starvation-inducible PsiE family protein n=1 Tax=Methanococcoides orientis TaxID=2822137 RepID=UPI001E5CE3FA|nr:phosphate-starvation-inducible PsiE family protein [Methanococcoides orientis]UGV39826.1 phosphate-starvation-inducible PsiE family protein [Methanococcoides orientis]